MTVGMLVSAERTCQAADFLNCKLTDVSADAEARTFEGYGSVFGNTDLGGDIVVPGAFQKSLDQHRANGTQPQMFFMHDPSKIPGKWMAMREDARGLYVKGRLSPTPLGDEMRVLLRDGALSGLSIGYQVLDSDVDSRGNRLLKQVSLWEVSIVSLPMNERAAVTTETVKHSSSFTIRDICDFERASREIFHFSRSAAKRFTRAAWPTFKAEHFGDGGPVENAVASIEEELQSAAVLAVIQHAAYKIRSI